MVQNRRLFGSEEFRPTAVQNTFYEQIDAAFAGTQRVRSSSSLPTRSSNTFAAYFRSVLTEGRAKLHELDDFGVLNPGSADRYVEFASDDNAWKRALDAKGQLPKSLQNTEFYRSAAYRCLRLFSMTDDEASAWKSLFQSVFYSDFCDKLGVIGRFGGRLHDLPSDFTVSRGTNGEDIIQLDITGNSAPNILVIKEGAGEAVRKTREKLRISSEDPLRHVWVSAKPDEDFLSVWRTVASTFAAYVGRQQATMSVSPELGILLTPDTTSPLGISLKIDPLRITKFVINYLKPTYQRYRIEKEVKDQILGIASIRAVRLSSGKSLDSST